MAGPSSCVSPRSRKTSRMATSVSRNTAIWKRIAMSKVKMIAAPPPAVIDDTNLSRAWARLLLQVLDRPGTEVAPLILSLSGFAERGVPAEDSAVRHALDRLLKRKGRLVIDDVAFTI